MVTVNAPDNSQIGQLLSEIRDLYGTLCVMTRRFLNEFSIPALQELLEERALVILKIDSEEDRLLRVSEPRTWKKYGEYKEIEDHISTIVSCDREIAARVTHGMNAISRELSSLSDFSSAAKTYIRHCRG
jgi:hypothetical protein